MIEERGMDGEEGDVERKGRTGGQGRMGGRGRERLEEGVEKKGMQSGVKGE